MVDFKVVSTLDDSPHEYGSNDPYLNGRWHDLYWETILDDILGIHLSAIYDSPIKYWAVDQVEMIYGALKALRKKDLPVDARRLDLTLDVLVRDFEQFVRDKCRICVF